MKARGLFASLFREKPPTNDDSIRGSLMTLMKSDKFPEKVEIGFSGPTSMWWENGLTVEAREGRWPRVDAKFNGALFTYEYDKELTDAVLEFAKRADAARDRSEFVTAINQLLQ